MKEQQRAIAGISVALPPAQGDTIISTLKRSFEGLEVVLVSSALSNLFSVHCPHTNSPAMGKPCALADTCK
jgi:hypothetical protein